MRLSAMRVQGWATRQRQLVLALCVLHGACKPLDGERCRVARELHEQVAIGVVQERKLRARYRSETQDEEEAFSWQEVVDQITNKRLCDDHIVTTAVFRLVVKSMWEVVKKHDWDLSKIAPHGHLLLQDTSPINYLLAVVDRLAVFVLHVRGLSDTELRYIHMEAHRRRCGAGTPERPPTSSVGWQGCFNAAQAVWKPDLSALTLSDRTQADFGVDVDSVTQTVDELYRKAGVVIFFPNPLVPTMRMLGVSPEQCPDSAQPQFGGGLTNADIEMFLLFRTLPRFSVASIFEIGNSFGYSTFVLAHVFAGARIDVIDAELAPCAWLGSKITRQLAAATKADVQLHIGLSPQAIPQAMRHPRQYDLAFIDGGHTVKQLVADFKGIRRSMANRSVVVLHDMEYFDLQHAVQLLRVSGLLNGFSYYRAGGQLYHNIVGTGLLVRGFSQGDMDGVGVEADWFSNDL
eukprot:TRINITY_DN24349_c0_g3_i1.p1 TRINITY_DN24349_c0_g3~~TRINITY_DN24349_c0_g3_i1.p1  ORF type:complete len:461 (-),score=44.59 TRINITY_DN24349_c0_g3_i1:97-1479(-)